MRIIAILTLLVLLVVLPVAGGQAVKRPEITIGPRLSRALTMHRLSFKEARTLLKALREGNEAVTAALRAYEDGEIRLREVRERLTQEFTAQTDPFVTECNDFADGVFLGCWITTGGEDPAYCMDLKEMAFCECMGGEYQGGGLCFY